MIILQFLRALRARIGVFVLVLAVTVAAAAAVSLTLPKSYKATVALLVDVKDEQSLGNPTQSLRFSAPQERQSYLQTQMDILNSPKVARQVVHDLGLAQNQQARAGYEQAGTGEGTIEDWLAESLLKKVKVETSQSNVILVTASFPDPQLSAQVANAFATAYLDTILELRVAPTREAAAWFDERLKALKSTLEAAQARLTDYLQRHRIVSSDARSDEDGARLGALAGQVSRAQEQAQQWRSRDQQARQQLERGGSPDRLPEVRDNPVIQRLKAELLVGDAKLQELASQYGSNYPTYQRELSQNRSLREKLDAETKAVVAGIEDSVRHSRRREADLGSAVAAQRTRILDQRRYRDEVAVLRHDVESAERVYDTTLQRAAVAQIESHVRKTNVALLHPASVPARPTSPKVAFNIALSVVVGTMLGIAMVMLMEMFDRRVRSRDDFNEEWGVPVLVVLNAWEPRKAALRLGHVRTGRLLPGPG